MIGVRISLATGAERERIYRMRHSVYARELGQHLENPAGALQDPVDGYNHYLVATANGDLAGFVSVTPPGRGPYSLDKYVDRSDLPFPFDDGLFEVRILTVDPRYRGTNVAASLGYAALRWVEAHGGTRIVITGRREVIGLYDRAGLRGLGLSIQSGAVDFEVMTATVDEVATRWRSDRLWRRLRPAIEWDLAIPFDPPPGAFHGGSSMEEVGVASDAATRSRDVIAADVLDAWFPPAPGVIESLETDAGWLARASPPTHAAQLLHEIAAARGVPPEALAVGAGLSDLVFRALPSWLSPTSRVVLIEPLYGEYRHVLETLVRCRVDRVAVEGTSPSEVLDAIARAASTRPDMVIVVNPNNPMGWHVPRHLLAPVLQGVPEQTLIWVDETYVDFVDRTESLESVAASSSNLIIGKSMSKVYALSGLRVGYLCGPPALLATLTASTPPWAVSRPAQMASVAALRDPAYYARRYEETGRLRRALADGLSRLAGIEVVGDRANFLLCRLDLSRVDAPTLVERTREAGLYIRAFPRDPGLRWDVVRIAVQDAATNRRIIRILEKVLAGDQTGNPATSADRIATSSTPEETLVGGRRA